MNMHSFIEDLKENIKDLLKEDYHFQIMPNKFRKDKYILLINSPILGRNSIIEEESERYFENKANKIIECNLYYVEINNTLNLQCRISSNFNSFNELKKLVLTFFNPENDNQKIENEFNKIEFNNPK